MRHFSLNRRKNERGYPPHERIGWSRSFGSPLHAGRVSDTSASGIAFDVGIEGAPGHGEAIRVLSRSVSTPRRARIVRISQLGRGMVRIACRWISRAEHPQLRNSGRSRCQYFARHDARPRIAPHREKMP